MVIFNSLFTAKSKKNNTPFYCVKLFEKRTTQDHEDYIKDVSFFITKETFDILSKENFKFGDIVDVTLVPPDYLGGSETLTGLKLVTESPYFD